ncbi:T9SS type A sorting domain-containing protein [Bacteroidales bacterium OttesenSCG-928-J19]|nr:T9SS type A sorting domain-containing protein [Bacteroidales bacterium OttesenSCG-928-J19]
MNKPVLFITVAILLLAGFQAQAQRIYPYITRVYDYCPAPGQFINKLPEYEDGDTKEDMIRKAEAYIARDERSLLCLGAYGGYVVFGFDNPVYNYPGEYDFQLLGNAQAPYSAGGNLIGSSEPGIVLVSYDANYNGEPDDEWYELAGSEYRNEKTVHSYTITYHKPEQDTDAIRWTDNQGGEGVVPRNMFHTQPYWPQWIEADSLVFSGTRLPDNCTIIKAGTQSYFSLDPYEWGYADNLPNNSEGSKFKIDWAVDKQGNPVNLTEVHFIKVYTGVNQYLSSLGETSTEVSGAIDLHAGGSSLDSSEPASVQLLTNPVGQELIFTSDRAQTVVIYSLNGTRILSYPAQVGTNRIDCSQLSPALYLLQTEGRNMKFIKAMH